MSNQQMLKTKLLHIDSYDFSTDGLGELIVSLSRPLYRVKSVRLVNFSIPYSFYNVYDNSVKGVSGFNNVFKFQIATSFNATTGIPSLYGSPIALSLQIGNYSTSTLADLLQSTLYSLYPSYNFKVSFSSNTGKFVINANTPFKLIYEENSLGALMGLTADLVSTKTPGNFSIMAVPNTSGNLYRAEFQSVAFVLRTTEIQIRSNLAYSVSQTSNSDDLLVSIPLSGTTFGYVISNSAFNNIGQLSFTTRSEEVQNFYIKLTDINKNLIDFNGVGFQMLLEFTYVSDGSTYN